jgi:hypothetical protein
MPPVREAMVVLLLAGCAHGYPRTQPDSKHFVMKARWQQPTQLRIRLVQVETCELEPDGPYGGCSDGECDDWYEENEYDCHPRPAAQKQVRARLMDGSRILDLGVTDRHGYVYVTGDLAEILAAHGGSLFVGSYRPGVELRVLDPR